MYHLRKEFRDYYENHDFAYPDDISKIESWHSLSDLVRSECEFVGNKNVYRIKDGKLYKVHLRTAKTRKKDWPFGDEKITVLYEYNYYFDYRIKRKLSTIELEEVFPIEIIELNVSIPEEFFVRQTLGKDAPSQEETLKDQAPTLDMANGV